MSKRHMTRYMAARSRLQGPSERQNGRTRDEVAANNFSEPTHGHAE